MVRLITSDGWILTEFTSGVLLSQFEGTIEELYFYVCNNHLKEDTNMSLYGNGYTSITKKPLTLLGDYKLTPDKNGIVATRGIQEI